MRQYEAMAKSTGQRCNHRALPGQAFCARHRRDAAGQTSLDRREETADEGAGAGLYAGRLPEAARRRLAGALQEEGLDQEIALMRLSIGASLDRPRLSQKWVDLLIKGVKARHELAKTSEDGLPQKLAAVFERLGEQFFPEGGPDSPPGQEQTETTKGLATDRADEPGKGRDQDGGGL